MRDEGMTMADNTDLEAKIIDAVYRGGCEPGELNRAIELIAAHFDAVGATLADKSVSSLSSLTVAGTVSDSTVYLIAPMVTADSYAPYTPYAGPQATAPLSFPSYAKASLPGAALFGVGAYAFCTDGRNTGETAGAGTGCPVFVKTVSGTPTWCAVWSGVAVTN